MLTAEQLMQAIRGAVSSIENLTPHAISECGTMLSFTYLQPNGVLAEFDVTVTELPVPDGQSIYS